MPDIPSCASEEVVPVEVLTIKAMGYFCKRLANGLYTCTAQMKGEGFNVVRPEKLNQNFVTIKALGEDVTTMVTGDGIHFDKIDRAENVRATILKETCRDVRSGDVKERFLLEIR